MLSFSAIGTPCSGPRGVALASRARDLRPGAVGRDQMKGVQVRVDGGDARQGGFAHGLGRGGARQDGVADAACC